MPAVVGLAARRPLVAPGADELGRLLVERRVYGVLDGLPYQIPDAPPRAATPCRLIRCSQARLAPLSPAVDRLRSYDEARAVLRYAVVNLRKILCVTGRGHRTPLSLAIIKLVSNGPLIAVSMGALCQK